MKKPNIIEGKWESDGTDVGVDCNEEFWDIICIAQNRKEDSRAISAVPEMIDALINARVYVKVAIARDRKNFGEAIESDLEDLEIIDNALKKAGVKF